MIVAVLLALLVLTDGVLCGLRASAGREGRLEKWAFYRASALRGLGSGAVVLAASAALAATLVLGADDPAAAWDAMVRAGDASTAIFAAYASTVFVAFAFFFAPIGDFRVLTNVLVFGPFTLARPYVIAGGLLAGVLRVRAAGAAWRVAVLAVAAGTAMLLFQRWMDRAYEDRWRRLV